MTADERHAAGHALGDRDQVRLDAGVLDGEHAPRAAEARLDLIGDEHDAVAVAQAAQAAQQLRRRGVEAAFTEHRLDDDRRHARRVHVRLEQLFERSQGVLHRDAVVGDREGQVIDLRQHRPEAGFVGLHLAGEADARERAAVKAAGKGDDRGALGVKARDLDGVLDRFRAGGEKDRLLRGCSGCECVQLLGERDVALVGGYLKTGVRELLQLPRDGGLHLRVQVAGVENRDTAREVDVAPTLDVPYFGVACALGVHHE